MELNIKIDAKKMDFQIVSKSGQGLDNLISAIKGQEISKVVIRGESRSYTFLRQVSLLVNLLIETKKVEVELHSKSFRSAKGMVFPIYE